MAGERQRSTASASTLLRYVEVVWGVVLESMNFHLAKACSAQHFGSDFLSPHGAKPGIILCGDAGN